MKYKAGDKLLVNATVISDTAGDILVETESRSQANLTDKDINSVVMLRFEVGDRVVFNDDHLELSGTVEAITYEYEPPQAWIKTTSRWALQTVLVKQLRRST